MVQIRNNSKLKQYVLSTLFIGSSILASSCGKTKIAGESKAAPTDGNEKVEEIITNQRSHNTGNGKKTNPAGEEVNSDSESYSDNDNEEDNSDSEGSINGSEQGDGSEDFIDIGIVDENEHHAHPVNLNTSINNQIVPNINPTKKIFIKSLENKMSPKTLEDLKNLINNLKTRDGFKGGWIEKYVGNDNVDYVKDLCRSLKINRYYMGLDDDNAKGKNKRNSLESIITYLDYACNGIKEQNGTIRHCSNPNEFRHRMENLLTILNMKEGKNYKYVGDGDKNIPLNVARDLEKQLKPMLKELNELDVKDSKLRISNLDKHKHTLRRNIEAIGKPVAKDLPENTLCGFIKSKKINTSEDEDRAIRLIYGLFRRGEEIEQKINDAESLYKEIIENNINSFADNYNHIREVINRCIKADPNWKTGKDLLKQLEFAPSLAVLIKTNGKLNPDLAYLDTE